MLRKKKTSRGLVPGKRRSPQADLALVRKVRKAHVPSPRQIKRIGRVLGRGERAMLRLAGAFIVLGILWYAGSAFLSGRTTVPAPGGTYTEALVGTPQLINPLFASVNDVDQDISSLIYTGLMRYDESQALVTDLATAYTVSDDKKTYRFELRKDVLWHDGEPLVARDVVFTIQTIQNADVGSPLAVSFRGVEVFAEDDHVVTFQLQEPFAPFLGTLTQGILPEHIWFDVSPERMKLHKQNIEAVGTGPYMPKRIQKDEGGNVYRYELIRNESFYREKPYIEEFAFQFFDTYDGDTGAIQALRSQRVDGIGFVPHDLKINVERKHITLHTLQLPQYTALFFNADQQPALGELDVRLALGHALDQKRILKESIEGEGRLLNGIILPGFPGYDESLPALEHSADQANELLDGDWEKISADQFAAIRKAELIADYGISTSTPTSTDAVSSTQENANEEVQTVLEEIDKIVESEMHETQTVYRKNKDNEILRIKIVTTNSEEYRVAAGLIAAAWREIGVVTTIEQVEARSISREVLRGRKYDVLLYGVIMGSDPDQYAFWHSSQVSSPGLNLSRYVNEDVDELLENIREQDDPAEISTLYASLQEQILEDRPAHFLYMPTYTFATTDRVQGQTIERVFHPSDRFSDVANWYVKTKSVWGDK